MFKLRSKFHSVIKRKFPPWSKQNPNPIRSEVYSMSEGKNSSPFVASRRLQRSPTRCTIPQEPTGTKPRSTTETTRTSKQTKPDEKQLPNTGTGRQRRVRGSDSQISTSEEATQTATISKTTATSQTVIKLSTQETQTNATEEEKIPVNNKRDTNRNTTNMNQKEIQRNIASFVPEFSGQNTAQRDIELTRFLGTADSIYEMLTTADERKIFDRLIKFKLTGDAYVRVIHKDVKDYKELKNLLESMYMRTQSLDELERNYMCTYQSYGETCRNYGYRLMEALDKYREGYKAKYELNDIDATYEKHLNRSAVQTYKKGINNIILRDKIATSQAENIEEIITESETTERMLVATTGEASMHYPTQQIGLHNQTPHYNPQQATVICNYCQKANHTWDVCRTRLQRVSNAQNPTRYGRNAYTPNRLSFTSQQINQYNRHPQSLPNERCPPQNVGRYNNFNQNYPQQKQASQYQPKYCSHCKTTKGHTYEECRSKFLMNGNQARSSNYTPNRNYNNTQGSTGYMSRNVPSTSLNQPTAHQDTSRNIPSTSYINSNKAQPPDTSNLEQRFTNMRINAIAPHQQQYEFREQIQENSRGSDQQ